MKNTNQTNSDTIPTTADKSQAENKATGKLPSLDQFMELVTAEQTSLAATPSGYNVYNKYHKSS